MQVNWNEYEWYVLSVSQDSATNLKFNGIIWSLLVLN